MADLRARKKDGRDYPGLDSGFNHLNEVFNGLTPGVYILAGAPSTGKTSLAKQIADHVAKVEKVPVLFWAFEQPEEALRLKSIARISQVNSRYIWKARLSEKQWLDAEKADQDYRRESGRWLTVIEGNYRTDTVEAIRAAALMAKHKAGKYANGKDKPVLLVLDFLQIMPPPEEGERLNGIKDIIDRNLSELGRISRDLKSPVLVISSENRAAYALKADNKKKKGPSLVGLKESGGIEYSADAVLCLWRDNAKSKELTEQFKRKTVRVEVHVLKNRNGELARIDLDFTPEWASFEQDKNQTKAEALNWSAAMGEGE
jgi:replicative DNA helicase